jgi:hypothetical protein
MKKKSAAMSDSLTAATMSFFNIGKITATRRVVANVKRNGKRGGRRPFFKREKRRGRRVFIVNNKK